MMQRMKWLSEAKGILKTLAILAKDGSVARSEEIDALVKDAGNMLEGCATFMADQDKEIERLRGVVVDYQDMVRGRLLGDEDEPE